MEKILNHKVSSYAELVGFIQEHPLLKSKDLLVTGCRFEDSLDPYLHIVVKQKQKIEDLTVEYIAVNPPGTGELFAALVLVVLSSASKSYAACAREASIQMKNVLQRIRDEKRSEFELRDILAACQAHPMK